MKSLERLVLAYLKDITRPLLVPLQFAYRVKRSVDDAVNMRLHYILQHLDKPGNYARNLFVDFSSAFNKIMPGLLSDKLTQLSVPTSICQWINSFLTDRQQLVRLGKLTSRTLTISTDAPRVAFSPHCSFHSTQMTALQRTADTRTVFTHRPYPSWTTYNTPYYFASVNNSSNLHLFIGHMHIHSSVYGYFILIFCIFFFYYYCNS